MFVDSKTFWLICLENPKTKKQTSDSAEAGLERALQAPLTYLVLFKFKAEMKTPRPLSNQCYESLTSLSLQVCKYRAFKKSCVDTSIVKFSVFSYFFNTKYLSCQSFNQTELDNACGYKWF